jgi:predicted metalloprotease with PDZ domain
MIMIRFSRTYLFVLFLVFSFYARPAAATVHYKISLDHPEQHVFHVTMTVPNASANEAVRIPAWNALYQIRDFAYRVRDVRVAVANAVLGESGQLPLHKLDKNTWEFGHGRDAVMSVGTRDLVFTYLIQWDDPGPFNSQLSPHHAFVNFAEVLMYGPARRDEDVSVEFVDVPAGWRIATALAPGSAANTFTAPSYDTLVDAPVEIGKFEEFTFTEAGAPIHVVVDAKEWNRARLEDALKRITGYELKLMGGAPYKEYTFFFRIGPYTEVGGGGMEHANCTAISAGSIEGAATTAAHEFFHLWNVKRIRPQSLEPVDYTKEQYTRALWFAEGVTSTYGAYALERSGIYTKEQWYGDLGEQITELQARPARLWQSVEESSLDAWLEKYDDYRQPDRSISYYNKGQIDGVLLDLAIRDATGNKKSLDDVMRGMNEKYAKAGKFYNDSEGIRGVVEEVAGQSFEEFFRRYVAGTDEIPYDKFLAAAGLEVKIDSNQLADLEFRAGRAPGTGSVVAQVTTGSAAEAAGLQKGDVLMGINGEGLPRNIRGWLRDHHARETVKLRVRRDGEEKEISYALGEGGGDRHYSIVESPNPSDKQRRIREGMLHGTTD